MSSADLIARLTQKGCLDHLTSGYIRSHYGKIEIPTALLQIICDHIGNIFLTFSPHLLMPDHMKLINDKKVVMVKAGKGYGHGASALINLPIPVDEKSKFTWNIKMTGGQNLKNYHYFIGVVSNNCKNWDCSAHAQLKDAFGILGGRNGISMKGSSSTTKECHNELFVADSLVCVEYDGKKQQITFSDLETRKQMFCMSLPTLEEVTHWYPAISLRDPGDTAEIIN